MKFMHGGMGRARSPQPGLRPLIIQNPLGDVGPKQTVVIPLTILDAACTSDYTFHTGDKHLAVVWAATFFCPDYKK